MARLCSIVTVMLLVTLAVLLSTAAPATATALCEDPTVEKVCAFPYEEGTEFTATSTKPTVTTSLGLVECETSSASGELVEEATGEGESLAGALTALTFEGCIFNEEVECTITAKRLPYHLLLSWTEKDDGSLSILDGGAGVPAVQVQCGAINCTFKGEPTAALDGGIAGSAVLAVNEKLEKESGFFCPTTAQWEADYVFESPAEGFAYVADRREPNTVLCTERKTPCPAGAPPGGKTLPLGTTVKGTLVGEAVFTYKFEGFNKVAKCTVGEIKGKSVVNGVALVGTLETLEFPTCATPCSVATSRSPYRLDIEAGRPPTGNGSFTIGTSAGNEPPDLIIHCGPNFVCKYEGPIRATLTGSATEPKVDISETMGIHSIPGEPNCSITMSWTAKFKVTTPTAAFVERAA